MRGRRDGRRDGRREAINVLGLSAFAGESSAALICDGRLAAIAREDSFAEGPVGVPWRAAAWCLSRAEVTGAHIDAVALAHKPLLAAGRVLRGGLAFAPSGWERFSREASERAADIFLGARLRSHFGFNGPLLFVDRAQAFAAAACAGAALERTAVILAGAECEWSDTALAVASTEKVVIAADLRHPHSIARLCDALRSALGVSWEEFGALARAGRPSFVETLTRELADFKPDGSLRLDMGYFSFAALLKPQSDRLAALVRGKNAADVAASAAVVAAETVARMAAEARRLAQTDDVCVAGALARWPASLTALRERTPGKVLVATGPAADAAVGAAMICWSQGLRGGRVTLDETLLSPDSNSRADGSTLPLVGALAALGWRCALGLVYFGVVTPCSLLARLIGTEFLPERFSETASYWNIRRPEDVGALSLRRRV